ncbi:MAG: hypothetical protein JWQ27_250 [Ferruginibacter sp.]|nr:hypothetical protein [Ferruginibacter sp.]
MDYSLVVLFSYSIFIAAIVGVGKIKNISSVYYPFVFLTWIAAINEVISFYASKYFHTNVLNNNIYVLFEPLFILWQFSEWKLFGKNKQLPLLIAVLVTIGWCIDYHDITNGSTVHLYYRIITSGFIVLCSVYLLSKVIIHYQKALVKHTVFLVCIGFILFFTFEIFIDIFWMYSSRFNAVFQSNVFKIITWINLFVNIIYAYAVICIPRRTPFITLY